MTLPQISQAFAGSQEFQSRYGMNTSDTQYVDALYSNLLGRSADKSGEAAWVMFLTGETAGMGAAAARADILVRFAVSGEEATNASSWLIDPAANALAVTADAGMSDQAVVTLVGLSGAAKTLTLFH